MKKNTFYLCLLLFFTAFLTGCEKPEDETQSNYSGNVLVLNYGGYESTPSSISKYNSQTDSISGNVYKTVNGVALNSNVQYMYQFNESVYMLGNSLDQIIKVEKDGLKQSLNGITDKIQKPRYCVAKDDYLYISCWGPNPDWFLMLDSYIAVLNTTTGKVESTIELSGGPEGLEIVGDNLYAALNFKESIAVVNLQNKEVSYIETGATTAYFLKSPDDNLYVSVVSYDTSKTVGLGYVNTTTNKLEKVYEVENMSAQYCSNMQANADFSKIYMISSAYDENWVLSGQIQVFDVETSTVESTPFVKDIVGINAIAVDPDNDNVYCFISKGGSENGIMKVYDKDASLLHETSTGISPAWALFLQ